MIGSAVFGARSIAKPIRQITRQDKANIFANNFARLHDLDIEAMKRGIAGDEFDRKGAPPAEPFSTIGKSHGETLYA